MVWKMHEAQTTLPDYVLYGNSPEYADTI